MRIKRYFGSNIRDAIRKVRTEQGPDAVILSNREVEGGFEIVAAIDFEEVLLTPEGLPPSTRPAQTIRGGITQCAAAAFRISAHFE